MAPSQSDLAPRRNMEAEEDDRRSSLRQVTTRGFRPALSSQGRPASGSPVERSRDALAEPPPVHDPDRPSALAHRRQRSPRPLRTGTPGTALGTAGVAPGVPHAASSIGAHAGSSPACGEAPAPVDADILATPTSADVEALLPEGVEAKEVLRRYVRSKRRAEGLARKWYGEFVRVRGREEERLRGAFRAEEEDEVVGRRGARRGGGGGGEGDEGGDGRGRGGGGGNRKGDHEGDEQDGHGGGSSAAGSGGASGSVSDGAYGPLGFATMSGGSPEEATITRQSGWSSSRSRSMKSKPTGGLAKLYNARMAASPPPQTPGTAGLPPYSPWRSHPGARHLDQELDDAESGVTSRKEASTPKKSSPSSGDVNLPLDVLKLDMAVKLKLLPAIALLRTPSAANEARAAERAWSCARAAHQLVRRNRKIMETPEGKALAGRCCFYIGVTRLAMEERDGKDHNPGVYFAEAVRLADGVFEEAEWAESWLDACQAQGPERAGSRSRTSGTDGTTTATTILNASSRILARPVRAGSAVVNGVWKYVMGEQRSQVDDRPPSVRNSRAAFSRLRLPLDAEKGGEDDLISPKGIEGLRRPGLGDRLPTFTTDESSSPIYDHHGVTWSESHPFGIGEVLPGKVFEVVQSPDRMSGFTENEDSPVDLAPLSLMGGNVPIQALKSPSNSLNDRPKLDKLRITNGEASDSTTGSSPPPHDLPASREHSNQRYHITNPDPPSDSSFPFPLQTETGPLLPTHKDSSYQPPIAHPSSPKTSSPRKSVVFDTLPALLKRESSSNPSSPTQIGLAARRRLSQAFTSGLAVISTHTARAPQDLLEQAEEGQSPFREAFGEEAEKMRVVHRRKRSTPEEMV